MANLKERLIEGTEAGDHWNHWPDLLEVVDITIVPQDNPHWMYDFGFRMGTSTVMRQVDRDRLPHKVRMWLQQWDNLQNLTSVHFTWTAAKGQRDDKERRNILALIPPKQEYDYVERKYYFASPGLMVEIGCDHDYDVTRPFRAVTHGKCKKCGHEWEVDSSD